MVSKPSGSFQWMTLQSTVGFTIKLRVSEHRLFTFYHFEVDKLNPPTHQCTGYCRVSIKQWLRLMTFPSESAPHIIQDRTIFKKRGISWT